MASSFRSHLRSPPPHNDTVTDVSRKQSTRIPTKTSNTEIKSKGTQHVSKLAKRASRSGTPAEKVEPGSKSTTRAPIPVTAAHHPPAAPRRTSVVPPSDALQLGYYAPPSNRHVGTPQPPTLRTPSLVSGSSASTYDSPRSTGLRRKPSAIDKYAAQKRVDTAPIEMDRATMHSRNEGYQEAFDDSIFGISLPITSTYPSKEISGSTGLSQRSSREWHVTRDTTPPMLAYAQSATPSTRYTDSPFSHAPTPSSASSYSPATVVTSGPMPRPRQQSPTRSRPPITSRTSDKADASRLGLPPVRESSTSSSNSTIKPSSSAYIPPRKEVPRKPSSALPPAKGVMVERNPSHAKPSAKSRTTQTARLPAQIPPELAHLNVDAPLNPPTQNNAPPTRPSRDGASSIQDMSRPSPIVQSDLPRLYTTYHKRTPSQETPISPTAPSPSFRSRFGLTSKGSSRQASPRVDSAISPPPSARVFARRPTPEIPPSETRRLPRTDSPAVGTAPSPSKAPRFGFLTRKPKADVSKVTEKPKRQPKKGPVAGTGHEGYGRFGFRGRSGSTTSSAGLRSSSTDSTASNASRPTASRPTTSRKGSLGSSKDGSELDDFLKERLTPVVLRGSGSTVSATITTTTTQPASVPDLSSSSSLESYPTPQLLPSAMQGDHGIHLAKRPNFGRRMPSDSSEDDVGARFPTLAARRSFTRLSRGESTSPARVPAPINTSLPPQAQSVDSFDAETSAWPQTDSTLPGMEEPVEGREGLWLRAQQHEPSAKPTRKWNFFQRAHAVPRPKGKERAAPAGDMLNTGQHQSPYRSVAHYAMMDPVVPVDLYEVEQIMQENETSPEDSMSDVQAPAKLVPYQRRHNGLLPSPTKVEIGRDSDFRAKPTPPRIVIRQDSSESPELLRARTAVPHPMPLVVNIPRSPIQSANGDPVPQMAAPEVRPAFSTPEMAPTPFGSQEKPSESGSPRQPRLSPIGRIPMVVSRRDRDRKLPDNSFSRPFARTQPHPSVKPPGTLYNQIRSSRELTSPVDLGSQPVSSTSTRSEGAPSDPKSSVNANPPSVTTNRTSIDMHASTDFFTFTPRKNSEVSYSSSSGNGSWMAALAAQPPQQDDPWTEYNDLLDDMMPQKTPISAGSSLGAPFQYANMLYNSASPSLPTPLNFSQPPSTELPPPPRSKTVPATLSVPQQVARFMQPSMSPLTPNTFLSDLVAHYDDQTASAVTTPNQSSLPHETRSSVIQCNRASLPSNARASVSSSRYSRASGHSRSASLPEANARNSQSSLTPSARFNKDTQLLDIAEDDDDEQVQKANLRFAALMTSKWLSFGRVLVSPAHNEMRLSDEPKVLVVDGLGSDWSYYVALSYPAATVYNLGPAPLNGSTSWPGINQKPPANHRHIPHSAISAAFPFPKGFFTAVVFRFPNATLDSAYHACIFECKRVLRPGGYLEVAVLDLDLMNMGARARSLVRGLKTRMQQHDCNVSLRNLSDVLVRMIGRRGFEEVQRCIVGVPAAGRIPRSQDISSASSGTSTKKPALSRETDHSFRGKEFSFADLLQDARNSQIEPSRGNDEDITKMVAKVGRWWYAACYETPLLGTGNSIWDDPALLRECEKQGTSFRLLICYAQKPTQTRRRTVSV